LLEKRVAALEGGVGALALASGQAASLFAIENVARATTSSAFSVLANMFQVPH
jgi:O-acetylhomoserine/O-acetylserine sulfhydrylase-like pyridoxal-dependent enzyme